MTRLILASIIGALLAPVIAQAAEVNTRCAVAHFIRAGGGELRSSGLNFNNGDREHAATIERLTITDHLGQVLHDSGPAIGVAHPLNTDYNPPLDITMVPPGATFYLVTTQIWGAGSVQPGPPERGFSMSAEVLVSKEGKRELFNVSANQRTRLRLIDPATGFVRQGNEISRSPTSCFEVKK